MFKYTICFIRNGHRLLLLNRNKSPEMGKWNGVGGKIEPGETITESVLRETFEETGIRLKDVYFAGRVIFKDSEGAEGMYVFLASLPHEMIIQTPKKIDEGILDWKDIDWITNRLNDGVAENLKYYLPKILNGEHHLEHTFIYDQHHLINYSFSKITDSLKII